MSLLDKLRKILGGGATPKSSEGDPYGIFFHFRCSRCGSLVRVRVDRRNDLNSEDGPGTYVLRKEIMDNKCFQLIHAEIWLDQNLNVVETDVQGGELITAEEYEAAQTEAADAP